MKFLPAAPQTPPGAHGWYYAWMLARGFSPYHPEQCPPHVRAEYEGRALNEARQWFHALAQDLRDCPPGTTGDFRSQLIFVVRDRLRRALEPFPPRNPYRTCPCHPVPLGMPRVQSDTIFDRRLAALRRRLKGDRP